MVFASKEGEEFIYEIGGDDDDESNASIIVSACEEGIQRMRAEETAQIVLPTDFAFGTSSSDKGKEIKKTFSNGKEISSSDTPFVTYVFEMKSMERAKDPWALTGEEKVERAEKLKSSGNAFFKKKEYASSRSEVFPRTSIRRTRRPTKRGNCKQNQSFESVLAFELRGVRVETIRVERSCRKLRRSFEN